MEFHEAANIFPLDEEHIDELAEDIRKNGQQVSIKIYHGKILDGRRRWIACAKAGVNPHTEEVDPPDTVAYVKSLNLHRRHLTPSQRSMCAARAVKLTEKYALEAKERQRLSEGRGRKGKENFPDLNTGQTRDQLGKDFDVSGRYVDYATKVLDNAVPEIVAAVDEGRMAVDTAAILSTEPEDEQRKEAANPKRRRNYKSVSKKQAAETNNGSTEENKPEEEGDQEKGEIKLKGVGVIRAGEAIDCLKRIPKNDALRKRGFQIVTDWIRHNK